MNTVQQIVDRLIADPAYRIKVAVWNNPDQVRMNYAQYYQDRVIPSQTEVRDHLLMLLASGSDSWQTIANVEWIPGQSTVFDQAMDQLNEELETEPELREQLQGEEGSSKWIQFVVMGVIAIAGLVGKISDNKRQKQAEEFERERLEQLARLQAEADARKAAETREQYKRFMLPAAVVLCIILLLIFLKRTKAS
jgi:flagellar basal body-associated protein FliL